MIFITLFLNTDINFIERLWVSPPPPPQWKSLGAPMNVDIIGNMMLTYSLIKFIDMPLFTLYVALC
jgi:hypothetical protein